MSAAVTVMTDRDALVMDVQIEAVWAFPTALRSALVNPEYHSPLVRAEARWLKDRRAEERKRKEGSRR